MIELRQTVKTNKNFSSKTEKINKWSSQLIGCDSAVCSSPSFRVYGRNFHILLILAMSLVYTRCPINDTINENGRNGQSHLQCEMHRDALVLARLRANFDEIKSESNAKRFSASTEQAGTKPSLAKKARSDQKCVFFFQRLFRLYSAMFSLHHSRGECTINCHWTWLMIALLRNGLFVYSFSRTCFWSCVCMH